MRLTNLAQAITTLSQASRNVVSPAAAVASDMSPVVFTRTLRASATSELFVEVGTGVFDPLQHVRILASYASDSGTPLAELADSYIKTIGSLGLSVGLYRQIIASIAGASDRPERPGSIPRVTPTYVHEAVALAIGSEHTVIHHMVTDFVCHMLSPLGWIIHDAPYVYRLRRSSVYPKFDDLVDALVTKNLADVLTVLARANGRLLVSASDDGRRNISPSQIAAHLASETMVAFDRAQGKYDAQAIVVQTLSILQKLWTPNLEADIAPRERVRNSSLVSTMSQNLALFHCAQEMIKRGISTGGMVFTDEELVNVVLPEFHSAMVTYSSFKEETISATIAHVGKRSTFDHQNRPRAMVVYEDWTAPTKVVAFSTIRHYANNAQRFLMEDVGTSAALSQALRPIQAMMSMERMIDSRLASFELDAEVGTETRGGPVCHIAAPSVDHSRVFNGVSDDGHDIKDKQVDDNSDDDLFMLLAHVASQNCNRVYVSAAPSDTFGANPDGLKLLTLVYEVMTSLKRPLADAAIVAGRVLTVEALESIAYARDFSPSTSLSPKEIPLDKHASSVHIWPWAENSLSLDFVATYPARFSGGVTLVSVDTHEMLGLGLRRRDVRFFVPEVQRAQARTWVRWMRDEVALLEELAVHARASDDSIVELAAVNGRRMQVALQASLALVSIGQVGVAANVSRLAQQRLAQALYADGRVDEIPALQAGLQRHRLAVWAGVATLQMLSLLDTDDIDWVLSFLKEQNALSMVVAISE